ncbi:MAG: metallophosphoesterase family protein [Desulfuromonadales bacterium]
MTRYAIGDIHGGSRTFRALLDRIQLRHTDRLYLLGDYVDRGNDSKGVLDIILQLMDSGYDVRPIRGNHDDLMLRGFTGKHDEFSGYWLRLWGNETLKSFGVESLNDLKTRYITLLDVLPYCREDGNFFFVHAGLDMTMDDPLTQTTPAQMLWGDAAFINSRPCADKIIESGHKIRSVTQIEQSLTSHHIQIDNGAFYQDEYPHTGNLVALNLDAMQLTFQPWLDGEEIE